MDSKIMRYLIGIPVLASKGIASVHNLLFPSSPALAEKKWGSSQKLVSLTTDAKIICSNPNLANNWPVSATITAAWEQVNFYGDGTSRPASFIWPPAGAILEKQDPSNAAEFIDNVIVANPSGKGTAYLKALEVQKDTKVIVKAPFDGYMLDVTVTVKAS
jgi:hypothetical protein